jgi:putative membrane protein
MKKLRKLLTGLAFLGLASLIVSCDKDKDDDNHTMANQDFVTQASSSNMFEVAAGNLALNKSGNMDVKAFGNHMVTDHGKAGTEMAALATKKGWTIPNALLKKEQANLDSLSGLTGTAFDQKFAAMMVVSHQQTIDLVERASSNNGVPDADLRGFASGKLPTLKEHLQDAQQLQTTVGR